VAPWPAGLGPHNQTTFFLSNIPNILLGCRNLGAPGNRGPGSVDQFDPAYRRGCTVCKLNGV
jgi:hypothetical protein